MCDRSLPPGAPVHVSDLRAAGLTRQQLRSPSWRRIHRGVRVAGTGPLDAATLLRAAALLLPPGAAIGGRSAAFLHGVDVRAGQPVDVVLPRNTPFSPRRGLRIRRALLPPDDLTTVDRLPVTTPLRTAFDLARLEPLVEAVTCLDALLHAGVVDRDRLAPYLDDHPGWRGVRRAAEALRYADPAAESPMESRLRMLLVLGGAPRPVVNQPVLDGVGRFVARPDLRIGRVIVEYDGEVHREPETFIADVRRQNRLVRAGYTVLRYTAADYHRRPAAVLAEVLAAVRPRGGPLA